MSRRSEHGSALMLFIAALLPFMFFLLLFGVELSDFYTERAKLQIYADNAAILGANYLPFADRAKNAAEYYLKLNAVEQVAHVLANTDSIRVDIDSSVPISFAKYFGFEQALEYKVTAKAALNPRYVDIYMDTSSYMAPDLASEDGTPVESTDENYDEEIWGENDGERYDSRNILNPSWGDWADDSPWPQAELFKRWNPAIKVKTGEQENAIQPFKLDAKLATQQCYNPSFSALKEATIRLYDYISAYPHNSVGVLVGPSLPEPVSSLREILPGGPVSEDLGEGILSKRSNSRMNDVFCLALSEYAREDHEGFRVPPERGEGHAYSRTSFTQINRNSHSNRPFYDNDIRLVRGNLSALSVRDILWSKAALKTITKENAQRDFYTSFTRVVNMMRERLMSARANSNRKGLQAAATYSGILMLGDLPWVQGKRVVVNGTTRDGVKSKIRQSLNRFAEEAAYYKVRSVLYVVYFRHYGNYVADGSFSEQCLDPGFEDDFEFCPVFYRDSNAFQKFVKNFNKSLAGTEKEKYFSVQVMRVPDISSLSQDAMRLIPLFDKAPILVH